MGKANQFFLSVVGCSRRACLLCGRWHLTPASGMADRRCGPRTSLTLVHHFCAPLSHSLRVCFLPRVSLISAAVPQRLHLPLAVEPTLSRRARRDAYLEVGRFVRAAKEGRTRRTRALAGAVAQRYADVRSGLGGLQGVGDRKRCFTFVC